jgi:hypothetical protein
VSVLTDISRAIREAVLPYGRTLADLPDDVLRDLAAMLSAFSLDVAAELRRRETA